MVRLIYCLVVLVCVLENLWAYQIPTPHILASLSGLAVTIPHENGITSVHVEVSRNSNTTTDNSSTWAGQSLLSQDYTNWVYQTIRARFEVGDILHCRISVTKDNQNYVKNVSIPIEYSDSPASPYTIPSPTIEVYRKGFQILMLHEYGVTFMLVEFKRNAEITKQSPSTRTEFGSLSPCSTWWIYRNFDEELKIGDTLYYRILVTKDGQLHTKEDGVYIVQHYAVDVATLSIKVLSEGFQLTIPHEKDITNISVEVKRGTKCSMGDSGVGETWKGVFSLCSDSKNWIYKNSNAKLTKGDILHFMVSVAKADKTHIEFGGAYEVKNEKRNNEPENCCLS